jgi:hypothetical protein
VAFRVDPGHTDDEYVDLIVTNADGMYSVFVENFDQYNHAIIIDERPGKPHVGIIWFTYGTTTEVDTGVDFRYDTIILDARVEVVATCSGCTLDVGLLTDDPNGFRDGVLTTTAGFIVDTGIITSGDSSDYTPDSTYGDLLYTILAGSDSGDLHHTQGGRTYLGHVVTGSASQSLTYTTNSTRTNTGYIYIEHMRLR